MKTAKERLLVFLKEINENPNALGKKLGYRDGQLVYYVLKERNGVSSEMADRIKKVYEWVSWEWLVRGIGEMYDKSVSLNNHTSKLLAMYPNQKISEDDVMEILWPTEIGELFVYKMKNNHMMPEFIAGDILGCQVVDKNAILEFGRKYIIKTINGTFVRKIMPGTNETNIFLNSTDDKKYPPMNIIINEIQKTAIVNNYLRHD